MVYYFNFGFVIEQALVELVKNYFDSMQLDDIYDNFHISVVNEHPFAHMIIDHNSRCADNFPSVVITSEMDSKPGELNNLPVQTIGIGLTKEDLINIKNIGWRNKTKIVNGNEVVVKKNGIIQKEKIPGYVLVYDEPTIENLIKIADSRNLDGQVGMIYGLKLVTRRRDRVSIEIWAENNQLKNEIYEHLRLFLIGVTKELLKSIYGVFNPVIFDGSINGNRGANYNFDFDTLLCGSNITFDIDYDISQIILDTDINNINNNLILEVINHVKK